MLSFINRIVASDLTDRSSEPLRTSSSGILNCLPAFFVVFYCWHSVFASVAADQLDFRNQERSTVKSWKSKMHKYELNNLRDIIPKSLNECSDSVYLIKNLEFGWRSFLLIRKKMSLYKCSDKWQMTFCARKSIMSPSKHGKLKVYFCEMGREIILLDWQFLSIFYILMTKEVFRTFAI